MERARRLHRSPLVGRAVTFLRRIALVRLTSFRFSTSVA
jgi:hypothetical protein